MARKKRSHTPGSIYKKNNKLVIELKGKKLYTGLNDTPEGREKAKLMKEQMYEQWLINRGTLPDHTKDFISAKEAFLEFVSHLERKQRSQATIRNYKLAFKLIYKEDYLINQRINNEYRIVFDIRRFVDTTNVGNVSINSYLRCIRSYLNYCYTQGYINKIDVMNLFGKPEKEKKPIAYNDRDLEKILEYFYETDEEFALWISFMRLTGSRSKESITLTWDQVDIEKRQILIYNKINTEKSEMIIVSDRVLNILERLLVLSTQRPKNKHKLFRWTYNGLSRLTRRFHDAEKLLGIEPTNGCFHKLRKAFATEIIENDLSIWEVKELMRHANINTTLKYYKEKNTLKLVDALNRIHH